MADTGNQFDPFGDIVALVSGPIAGAIRSIEQLRRGADEFMRGVENFNTTMENLNETAARVNRMLNELEEPLRIVVPQVTRTMKFADDATQRIAELPFDPTDVLKAFMDLTNRLAPLAQMAESASGMFGIRIPGLSRSAPPPPPPAPEPAAKPTSKKSPAKKSTSSRSSTAKKSTSSR